MLYFLVLLSQYEDLVSNVAFPAQLGEVAIMLRFLIKGAKPQPLDAAASLPAAGWAASAAFDNSAVRPRVKPLAGCTTRAAYWREVALS